MANEDARLPIATIAPRVCVVELVNTLSADRTVAVICRILIGPARFIVGDRGIGVDGAAPDALKLVAVAGG